jgi:O-acetyl-ADP-ribose deacetylase (regulator of RNase III)
MNVTVVDGDLFDEDVDVIVNAWNRNIIPWWLLIPQGVSGAIKNRGYKSIALPLIGAGTGGSGLSSVSV